jgi:transposase-like protein
MGKRRTYTKEFKEQAVALYEAGDKSAEEVGRELAACRTYPQSMV